MEASVNWVTSRDGRVAVNLARVVSLELERAGLRGGSSTYTLRAFATTQPNEGVVLASGMSEEAGEGLLKLIMLLPAGENLDLSNLSDGWSGLREPSFGGKVR
jgi:hypothetical protein